MPCRILCNGVQQEGVKCHNRMKICYQIGITLLYKNVSERGLPEAICLRKQRERYQEKQQELARRQQEEQRLQEEIQQKEQHSIFRKFLSEYTEEGENYSIARKTLKDWYRAWVLDNKLPDYVSHPIDEVLKDKFLRDEQGDPVYPRRITGLRMKRPITLPTTYMPAIYTAKRQPRKHITKSTRKDILDQFNASGRICALCGKAVEAHEKLHLDHIIPVAEGGMGDASNLQYVHERCNMMKSSIPVDNAKKKLRLRALRSTTRSMSHSSNMAIRYGENTSICEVVAWHDQKEKWQAQICINDRLEHLGYYKDGENAFKAFQDVLNNMRENISIFEGVKWIDRRKKWQAQIWIDGRLEHLGYFKDEEDAHKIYHQAYQKVLDNMEREELSLP
jgi:5-methylcytosine-specific restriction enzyme A